MQVSNWFDHGQVPGQTPAGQRKVPQDSDTIAHSRGNRKQGIEPRRDARGESRRGCEAMTLRYLLLGSGGLSLIPATMSFGKYVDSTSIGGFDSVEVGTEVGVSGPRVRTESVFFPMVKERRSPPSIPHVKTPNTMRINKAGMAAMAHFTMKMTIEKNGIRMSVTTTACLLVSSAIITPPLCRQARPTVGRSQGDGEQP